MTENFKASKKALITAVAKATSSSVKPPKEKHVRRLYLQTYAKDDTLNEEILRALCKRLEKASWVVVLKALIVFHRCFREGDPHFIESLRTRSNTIFALRSFSANAPQGNVYTLFVRKYAKYLEEKVSVLRLVGFQFEKVRDSCKGLTDKDSFKRVPKLQSQINALLNCKMRAQHIGKNPLIIGTYLLLLKDSLVLYPILNDGVISLIDRVFKMKKKEAQRVLDIYTLFVKETDALISLYEVSRTFAVHLPIIHRAKATLIETLQAHISKMPEDESAGPEEHDQEEKQAFDDSDITGSSASYPTATDAGDDDDDGNEADDSSGSEDDVPAREPLPSFLADKARVPASADTNNGPAAPPNKQQLVHSASLAHLSSTVPQQPKNVTSQGWAVFDDAPPSTAAPGSYHPPSGHASLTFSSSLDSVGFDAWASDFSGSGNPTATNPGTANPFGGQPSQLPANHPSYQQKADNIKNLLGHYYTNPTTQPTANPFADAPAPALSNPFLAQQPTQPQAQQQQPQPFNPFL